MGIMFFAMIIVIVVLIIKNQNLKNENNILKQIRVNRLSFCPKCGFGFSYTNKKISFCPKCGHSFIGNPQPSNNQVIHNNINIKEKYTDKEIKNSLILTTGSVLVIFSAIAFLASTWNITSNFVKTLILLLMLLVFFAVSYIADKQLKLKQTSKTFYYIALAYIPIVLLSVSMFGLFGNYLSLNGNGRYIYLTMISILVSTIYHFVSKNRNSKLLFVFNIIFQLLSVVFFVLIFTNEISAIYLGLLIYSIVISICYVMNKIYFSDKIHLNISTVLCSSVSFLLVSQNFINILINKINVFDVLTFALMLINVYLVIVKIWNKDNIYKFLYPICIMLTFNNLSYLFDNMMFRQSLILASYAVIFIYNIVKENKINIITYIEILVSFALFNMAWGILGSFAIQLLDSYILFGVVTFLSLINYVYDKNYKSFSSTMLGIGIIITILSIAIKFEISAIIVGCTSFILILISILKNINIGLKNGFKCVGLVSLFIVTLFNRGYDLYSLISYIIYSIVLLGYGIKNKDDIYKIFSYIYINIVLLQLFDFINFDYSIYIIPATTIIFSVIERLLPSIRSKASDVYLILSYILSTLMLLNTIDDYNWIAMIIISLSFICYISYYKKNKNYLCVPFVGMIPHIYFSNTFILNNFNVMYVVSIIALLGIVSLIYYKKRNLYITMFYVYSFFHLLCLEEIKYVSILLLIIGSFVCYLIKNNKVKDLCKAILYLLGLVLYNTIISDLGLGNLNSLLAISYIVFTLLITRTILKKYGDGYKVWEYIFSIIINLFVLVSYSSEYDAIIYVVLLTIVVIVSYILKYGPMFLVCLISIIINSLILTRTILGDIPWWLYILIIGGVLIGFAIYNEVKDNTKEKDERNRLDL